MLCVRQGTSSWEYSDKLRNWRDNLSVEAGSEMTLLLQTHIPESSLFNLVLWFRAIPRNLHFLRGHPGGARAGGP